MHVDTSLDYVIVVIVYMMACQSPACLLGEPERSVLFIFFFMWGCRIEKDDLEKNLTASLKNCRLCLPLPQICYGVLQLCSSGLHIILP